MKTISMFGRAALLLACACLALACAKLNGTSNEVSPAPPSTANAVTPPSAAPQNPEDKMTRITAQDSKKLVDAGTAIIIDVRGTDAWKQQHIKDALDINLGKLEGNDFQNLPRDKRIIAYCT